ncbi:MAG: alpha/beta hydrolase, partial [Microthrixaceae bacterium]
MHQPRPTSTNPFARAHMVLIATVVALVAAACTSNGQILATASSEERPGTGGGPATTADEELVWSSCLDEVASVAGLECATLAVPVDHAEPDGDTLDLEIARVPSTASAEDRIGSLLFNPGGPGGSGIEFLANASAIMPAELTDRFDLVSWDPRGVGDSTPVRCLTDDEKDAQIEGDLSPDTDEELDRAIEDQAEFVEGCETNHPDLIDNMSTADVAADLDLIRQALGDDQLNYVGFSYGTAIGATYATLFPDKVRAMVLDGAVSPTADDLQLSITQAQGFERTYLNFIESCDSQPECALSGGTASTVEKVRDQLDAEPLAVDTDSGTRELTRDLFDIGLATALYDTTVWGPTARSIAEISTGTGGDFMLSLADRQVGRNPDGTWDNSTDAQVMVNCADSTYRPSLEEALEDGETLVDASPTFGETFRTGALGCVNWPLAANPVPEWTAAGAPPILVVGTVGDPATPYEWAEQMTAALVGSVLLTYEGDGHTAFLRAGACVDDAVVAYLVDLVVPPPGTRCPVEEGAQGESSFAGIRSLLIEELTAAGIPEEAASCIVDELEAELGTSGLDELILGDNPEALTESVTRAALTCQQ